MVLTLFGGFVRKSKYNNWNFKLLCSSSLTSVTEWAIINFLRIFLFIILKLRMVAILYYPMPLKTKAQLLMWNLITLCD